MLIRTWRVLENLQRRFKKYVQSVIDSDKFYFSTSESIELGKETSDGLITCISGAEAFFRKNISSKVYIDPRDASYLKQVTLYLGDGIDSMFCYESLLILTEHVIIPVYLKYFDKNQEQAVKKYLISLDGLKCQKNVKNIIGLVPVMEVCEKL